MLDRLRKAGLCVGIAFSAMAMMACGDDSGSGGDGKPAEEAECSAEKPCEGENMECSAEGKCVKKGGDVVEDKCTSDDDCKDKTDTPKCDTASGKCVKGEEPVEKPIEEICTGDNKIVCEVDGTKVCVEDKTIDEVHCGKCNNPCGDEKKCENGECVDRVKCDESKNEIKCGGVCVDKLTDSNNCGSCEHKCNTINNETCNNGTCTAPEVTCEEGEEKCGGVCAKLKEDKNNCGACNNVCEGDESCVDGTCTLKCSEGYTTCAEQKRCADITKDNENCGACGTVCESGKQCVAVEDNDGNVTGGKCDDVCKDPGLPNLCGSECVNLQNDNNNCGECGTKCVGAQSCSAGKCSDKCEVEGEIRCNGKCIDPKKDQEFCGASGICDEREGTIGKTCANSCSDGECVACPDPSSSETCGCTVESKGLNCVELEHITEGKCVDNACQIVCQEGYANCNATEENGMADGCEARLNTNENCGGCGMKCGDGENVESASCDLGICELTCKDNLTACVVTDENGSKGTCSDLSKDVNNCGICGNVCDTENGQECIEGACVVTKCGDDGYVSYNLTTYDGTKKPKSKTVKAYCIDSLDKLTALQEIKQFDGHAEYPDGNSDDAFILLDNFKITGSNWSPFKLQQSYFIGNGKKITSAGAINVTSNSGMNTAGFFSTVNQSVVDGLTLELNVTAQNLANVGVLAGTIQGNSLINRCVVEGDATGKNIVGGLVGSSVASKIDRSKYTGSVTSSNGTTGGIIGKASNTRIENCIADGKVFANAGSYNGGVVGLCENDSHIENTTTSVGVEAQAAYAGGIAGQISDSYISACKASGKVKGDVIIKNSNGTSKENAWDYMGGIAGKTSNGTISQTEASGEVFGNNYVGGFVGQAQGTEFSNNKVTGNVTGRCYTTGYVGGFAGELSLSKVNIAEVKNNIEVKKLNGSANARYIGGFAGNIKGAGKSINEANYTGTISIQANSDSSTYIGTYLGGLIGHVQDGIDISKCNATTKTLLGSQFIGGLIGQIEGSGGSVTESSASGNTVTAISTYVGGLVGYANGTKFKKCTAKPQVYGSNSYSGGLIGYMTGGSVEESEASGNIESSSSYVGGLVGYATNNITFTKSNASGTVKGRSYLGGLVGFYSGTTSNITFSECNASGTVTAYNSENGSTAGQCGGLIGYASGGVKINDSHAKGAVTCGGYQVGGLIGLFSGSGAAAAYVKNCTAHNSVKGSDWVGGLIGGSGSSGHTVENSISSGQVDATGGCVGNFIGHCVRGTYKNSIAYGTTKTNSQWVGGFVGHNDSSCVFEKDIAVGSVNGFNASGGGFLGHSYSTATFNNVLSLVDVTGNGRAGGLVGTNTSRLTVKNSYSYGSVSSQGGNSNAGKFMGQTQTSNGNYTIDNVYWWAKSTSGNNVIGSSSYALPNTSKGDSFDFDEEKKLVTSKSKSLLEALNNGGNDWVEAECGFKAGNVSISDKVKIPMVSGLLPDQEDYIKCTLPKSE